MSVRIVRLGSERSPGEGLRIGAVRWLPRGVPRSEYSSRDLFDVWFPVLAPSAELLRARRAETTPAAWQRFASRFRSEMREPAARHSLDLLAALSEHNDFGIGCYCADESRCHRRILRELLARRGALMSR